MCLSQKHLTDSGDMIWKKNKTPQHKYSATTDSLLQKHSISNLRAMRQMGSNPRETLLFPWTYSGARPIQRECCIGSSAFSRVSGGCGYTHNKTSQIVQLLWEMQKSTICKLRQPPVKSTRVLQGQTPWCPCTTIPPALQILEVFWTVDINYPEQSKFRSRFPAKLIKSPGTWNTAQKHPCGSVQSQLGSIRTY